MSEPNVPEVSPMGELHGPLAVAFNAYAADKPTEDVPEDRQDYYRSLADASREVRAAAEDDSLTKATKAYAQKSADATNLHAVHADDGIRFDPDAVPVADYDAREFESALGLLPDSMHDDNLSDACKLVDEMFQAVIADAPNEVEFEAATDQESEMIVALERRAMLAIDGFRSPTFGTASNRTEAQAAAVDAMWNDAKKHAFALHAKGFTVPTVEKLLNRVRLKHDAQHFEPGKKRSTASKPAASAGGKAAATNPLPITNIHAAYICNKS